MLNHVLELSNWYKCLLSKPLSFRHLTFVCYSENFHLGKFISEKNLLLIDYSLSLYFLVFFIWS